MRKHDLQHQMKNKYDYDDNLNTRIMKKFCCHGNTTWWHNICEIGHFWLHFSLYFKTSQRAKSLNEIRISVFIHIEIRANYENNKFPFRLALKNSGELGNSSWGKSTWLAATFSFPFAFPLVWEVLVFLVGAVFEPLAPFLDTAVVTTFFPGDFVGLGAP